MSAPKRPRYAEIDGLKFSMSFNPENVRAIQNYKPTSSDVFVVTYPKCGTTWMIQIVILILRRGKLPADHLEYFACSPFLEILGPDAIMTMPGPGCLKTHLPFDRTPFSPRAKYIFVARHPRDCVVSMYHHIKFFPAYYFTDGSFDEFFDAFLEGEVDYGDYFDHLLSWYEHRHEPNILFMTFEEMKADLRGVILRVAKFLGEEYLRELEEDEELLMEIITKSGINYMKDATNKMFREIVDNSKAIMNNQNAPPGIRLWAKVNGDALEAGEKSIGQFVRSGGGSKDGKIRLSEEQEKRLEQRIKEKTRDSDAMNLLR